jgi:hypothetical protein
MKTLDMICEDLEIPRELVKEYSDNFDPAISGRMNHLLSNHFVNDSLHQIKDKKGPVLYKEFVAELFEGLYWFQKQDNLKYLTNFSDCYARAESLVRSEYSRTPESEELKSRIRGFLAPYRQELGKNEIGCLLYGSVFHGDSDKKSDIDVIFCAESRTPQAESALGKINDGLRNKPELDVSMRDAYILKEMQERLKRIAEGKVDSITDYTQDKKPWTLFTIKNDYLPILFSEELVEKPGLITLELQRTKELLVDAVHKDPILNFMVTYALADNIDIRAKKQASR